MYIDREDECLMDEFEEWGELVREDNNTGGSVEVRRYKDGSSVVKWEGFCGSTRYNKHGEEC